MGDIVGVGGSRPSLRNLDFNPGSSGPDPTVSKNMSLNWPIRHSLPGASETRMWDGWRPYLSQQPLQGIDPPVLAEDALAEVPVAQSSKQPPALDIPRSGFPAS